MKNVLDEILHHIQNQKTKAPQIYFDLDSTLFCVSHRTQNILRELAKDEIFKKRFPEESLQLESIIADPKDWGIRGILQRSGIRANLEFFEAIREHWVKYFFSNHKLHIDQPYSGAVEFVQNLHKHGAHIRYLTGRDVHRMGEGTLASLLQWNFPLNKTEDLVMKPHQDMDDAEFKKSHLAQAITPDDSVWFFENEPVIINLIQTNLPHIKIVFMDSVHSGREQVPPGIPTISLEYNFTRK